MCCHTYAVTIGFSSPVVVVFSIFSLILRPQFIDTQAVVDLRRIIVRVDHRNYCIGFHKYGQLPCGRFKIIPYNPAGILVSAEIVKPSALRQIYVVTVICSAISSKCFLIYGSYKKRRSIHKLIACSRAVSIIIRIIKEHCPYHRLAVNGFTGCRIGIRQQFGLQFQISAVYSFGSFNCLRIFRIRTPAIHVKFHWRKRFPLEITYIHH